MIPQQTFESYPVFGDNATKVQPDNAKYSAGFQQADVLPAEWVNWFWNKSSKGVTDLNEGLDSVEKEIIAVLTEYNITPAKATTNQLLQALKQIKPQVASCTTGSSTAAKEISISGNVLKAGNIYAISMTHGNSAADPTLSINGGTAYPMYDTKGNKLASGAWQDDTYVIVLFTGTRYIMILIDDTIENGNMNAVTSNAVSCILASSTTITGPKLGTGGQIKIMFTADISGADTSTGLSLTYNGSSIPVKAAKDGSLVDFKAYEVSSGVYKYLQAYTTLELVYDSANSRFVVVGNPVVISTSYFLVYSNGLYKNLKYSTTSEQFTGEYWTDSKPIFRKVYDVNISTIVNGWVYTDISVTGMDTITKANYLNVGAPVDGLVQITQKSNNSLRLYTTNAWNISSIILEYTKS